MPPNALQLWDLNATKRHLHNLRVNDDDDDDENDHHHYHDELLTTKLVLPPVPVKISDGRSLWKKLLDNEVDTASRFSFKLLEALSSIIVLDDDQRNRDWLNRFGGRLHKVSSKLLEGLRTHAPDLQTMSTVADFNDNLCYHMQQERGLRNFGSLDSDAVEELEDNIQANEYLGSFLTTKSSLPQPAHVDYPWEVLQQHGKNLRLGFFPLTEEGMFLQVWPTVEYDPQQEVEGQLIYIPKGTLLTVPASTIHGGGFRTTTNDVARGNLRFHLYIATNSAQLPAHQTNKYTEPNDRRKELSRRCVDSKHMGTLMKNLFV